MRYPRGCEMNNSEYSYDGGDFTVIGGGCKKAIVTYGRLFSNALPVKKICPDVDIIKLNKIYPISDSLVKTLLKYNALHFFEENVKSGGIGEHISLKLAENSYKGHYCVHAIPNEFVPSAKVSSALKKYGLDTDSMIKFVKEDFDE